VDPEEVARCEAAGARFEQKYMKVPAPFPRCCTSMVEKPNGKPRIYPGGLLVTRSFGDLHAKIPEVGGCVGGVIHDPDPIAEVDIQDDWLYFIVASDGVWDAVEPKKVFPVMKQIFDDVEFDYGKEDDKKEKVRQKVTKNFVQFCVDSEYWTRTGGDADNTTAIVLFF
jgi:serine/threonine protein phosphatase PrpC